MKHNQVGTHGPMVTVGTSSQIRRLKDRSFRRQSKKILLIQKLRNAAVKLLCFATIAIFVFWGFEMFLLFIKYRRYDHRRIEMGNEIIKINQTIERLQQMQKLFLSDKHFVERLGHELGFAYEGETIYEFSEVSAGAKKEILLGDDSQLNSRKRR